VQPPRGRWSELAWASVVLTWVAGVGFGILQLAIGSHAHWLKWITNTIGTIVLIVLATFLYTRGREVIDYRRRSRRDA
jgi:uncharacterized membrane protein